MMSYGTHWTSNTHLCKHACAHNALFCTSLPRTVVLKVLQRAAVNSIFFPHSTEVASQTSSCAHPLACSVPRSLWRSWFGYGLPTRISRNMAAGRKWAQPFSSPDYRQPFPVLSSAKQPSSFSLPALVYICCLQFLFPALPQFLCIQTVINNVHTTDKNKPFPDRALLPSSNKVFYVQPWTNHSSCKRKWPQRSQSQWIHAMITSCFLSSAIMEFYDK